MVEQHDKLYGYVSEKHGAFYDEILTDPRSLTPIVTLSDYVALEAQLAERVKVKRAKVIEILNNLSRAGELVVYETADDAGLEIEDYATLVMKILSALEATPPTQKVMEAIREFAEKQSSTDTDIQAALGNRSELYFPAAQEAGKT